MCGGLGRGLLWSIFSGHSPEPQSRTDVSVCLFCLWWAGLSGGGAGGVVRLCTGPAVICGFTSGAKRRDVGPSTEHQDY